MPPATEADRWMKNLRQATHEVEGVLETACCLLGQLLLYSLGGGPVLLSLPLRIPLSVLVPHPIPLVLLLHPLPPATLSLTVIDDCIWCS